MQAIWSPAIVIWSSIANNNKRIHSKSPSWDEILHFFLYFIHQQIGEEIWRTLLDEWFHSFSYEKKETVTAFGQWREVSCVYSRRKDGMDGKIKKEKNITEGERRRNVNIWLLPLIFPPWQLTLNWRSQIKNFKLILDLKKKKIN